MTDGQYRNNELYSYSEEELKNELERRRQARAMPEMAENPNLDDLRDTVRSYAQAIATMNYHPDDNYTHYIFEAAVEAFYGSDFWNWMSRVPKR